MLFIRTRQNGIVTECRQPAEHQVAYFSHHRVDTKRRLNPDPHTRVDWAECRYRVGGFFRFYHLAHTDSDRLGIVWIPPKKYPEPVASPVHRIEPRLGSVGEPQRP